MMRPGCKVELSQRVRAPAAVVGGILIHLTLGNLYSFGNMMTYMVSYMHERVNPNITYANFLWVNSITTAAQGLFMVVGGLLERRVGPRLTCFVGCSLLSAGILLTCYTVEVSLLAVILTYGLLAGIGIALSYVTPLACGMQWYPNNKGVVNGLIVAGFGLGALGSTNLQTFYLNPSNIPPGPDGYFTQDTILDKVPSVFVLMAVVFLVLQYLGCLGLNKPSAEDVQTYRNTGLTLTAGQEGERLLNKEEDSDTDTTNKPEEQESQPSTDSPTHSCSPDLKPQQVLRNKTFYIFWSIYLLNTIAIGYINAMYKSFGQTFIQDDHFLATVGSLAAIFNAAGRVLWGHLMDRTSFKVAIRCVVTLLVVLFASLPLTPHLGKVGFTAWVWAIFFTFSGTFVLMPTVIEKAFGSAHYSANYGLLFTSQTVSGPLMAAVNQSMLSAVGYSGCFLTISGLLTLGLALSFFIPAGL